MRVRVRGRVRVRARVRVKGELAGHRKEGGLTEEVL